MKILGIETSCDETAAAVVDGRKVLSNVISSQASIHSPFGGVVPEIASRHHVENLPQIVETALREAGLLLSDIDGIAATHAPGLLGALLVGLQYGKSLAFALGKPFIGVHHLEAHLHSVFLEQEEIEYPFIGFIVSGGHTHLYHVPEFGCYQLVGSTCDDAVGEAYDKVAKLLGLGYPGGPRLDALAGRGDKTRFRLTEPRLKQGAFDFSFSGVKTACLLLTKKESRPLPEKFKADLAASFQEMATDYLVKRLAQALEKFQLNRCVVAGGVAANSALRAKLARLSEKKSIRFFIPSVPLCTDNGAMIAYTGGRYLEQGISSPLHLNAFAQQPLPSSLLANQNQTP